MRKWETSILGSFLLGLFTPNLGVLRDASLSPSGCVWLSPTTVSSQVKILNNGHASLVSKLVIDSLEPSISLWHLSFEVSKHWLTVRSSPAADGRERLPETSDRVVIIAVFQWSCSSETPTLAHYCLLETLYPTSQAITQTLGEKRSTGQSIPTRSSVIMLIGSLDLSDRELR